MSSARDENLQIFLFSCWAAAFWLWRPCVICAGGLNNIGGAVQTDPWLLRYASANEERKKCNIKQCWDLLANTVASVCTGLKIDFWKFRLFYLRYFIIPRQTYSIRISVPQQCDISGLTWGNKFSIICLKVGLSLASFAQHFNRISS